MNEVKKRIAALKIVPVIKLGRPEDAAPLADALLAGGLPVAEITFRTDAAEESIRIVAREKPELLLGAGTVTSVEQAERAVAAGARFVVTPGFSRAVTAYCVDAGVPIFPGVCTPTELMWLAEYGLDVAKFFPAAQFGGLATIKALATPFPGMRFMPTGGITQKNLPEYLAFPRVIACGGSWMVPEGLITAGEFQQIAALVKEAVALAGNCGQ